MIKKVVILLVIGLVLGLGFFLLSIPGIRRDLAQNSANPTPGPESPGLVETENGIFAGEVLIELGNVTPNNSITLDRVNLLSPAWVVVFEDDNGQKGMVLGVSVLLPKGESQGVIIDLQRKIVRGESIYIGLHSDDGDSKFTYPEGLDIPMMVRGGKQFIKKISVGE